MATPAQLMQIARFNTLAAVSGEKLTYMQSTVLAIVNRIAKAGRIDRVSIRDGKTHFTLGGTSSIEILFTSLQTAPQPAQSFLDAFGARHRIKNVEQTDVAWVITCEINALP